VSLIDEKLKHLGNQQMQGAKDYFLISKIATLATTGI
jgi:hypothetical protein